MLQSREIHERSALRPLQFARLEAQPHDRAPESGGDLPEGHLSGSGEIDRAAVDFTVHDRLVEQPKRVVEMDDLHAVIAGPGGKHR